MRQTNVNADELLALHSNLFSDAAKIMKQKNHDYTGDNGDVFRNFRQAQTLGIHPVKGMMLRQMDKMQRINTYLEKGELKVTNETVKDAIVDQLNYLVLQYAYILEEERLSK